MQREFEEYAKKLAADQAAKERAKQDAKKESERRSQKKIAIAQVLVPLITFILGILVEHLSGLIDSFWRWVKELIK